MKVNKRQIIKLSEGQIKRVLELMINEQFEMNELDYESFRTNENLEILRNALDKNKTVSVAFVKKDGSVRHMGVRKYLSSYVPSEKEKTEKQANVESNNNLKRVIDINAYIRTLKETGDKELASKSAWRTINLKNVLGFLTGGQFIDLRDENEIMERFGEEVNNSLTKSMVRSMEQQAEDVENIEEPDNVPDQEEMNEYDNYNYPDGADADPDAPWKQEGIDPGDEWYEDWEIENNSDVKLISNLNGIYIIRDPEELFGDLNDEEYHDLFDKLENIRKYPDTMKFIDDRVKNFVEKIGEDNIEWEHDEYDDDEYDDGTDDYINENKREKVIKLKESDITKIVANIIKEQRNKK